jgi:hypothetical protein
MIKALTQRLEALLAEGRPKELHAHPCAHCPSVRSPDDPESIDVRDHCALDEKIESVFRCAWRREKACRGYADFIGVTEKDLA